jgi:hypothetical protein
MSPERDRQNGPPPQTRQSHPDEWQQDLNSNHLAGQNIGPTSDAAAPTAPLTAFHLRKRGHLPQALDDADLKQVPLVTEGARLQQGATYVNLTSEPPREFKASAEIITRQGDAYAPKDKVPYEIWNRLIGEPKPGQE